MSPRHLPVHFPYTLECALLQGALAVGACLAVALHRLVPSALCYGVAAALLLTMLVVGARMLVVRRRWYAARRYVMTEHATRGQRPLRVTGF